MNLPSIRNLPFAHLWPFQGPVTLPKTTSLQINNLQDLVRLIQTTPNIEELGVRQAEIKALMNSEQINMQELDNCLTTLIEESITKNPDKIFSFLASVLSQPQMLELIRYKTNNPHFKFDLAIEQTQKDKLIYPHPISTSLKQGLKKEWQRASPTFLYFIPRLINTCIEAFSFLDAHEKLVGLWDKYLLLEIAYKFFLIPFFLVQTLTPILVSRVKVYATALAIITGCSLLLFIYQRWFKPVPKYLSNCVNLNTKEELGEFTPNVGQAAELNKLIGCLLTGSNVLIVGKSGEGKTALIRHYVQLKKAHQISPALQSIHDFSLDCARLLGEVNFGHAELLKQTRSQIKGFEDKILIFFDEVDQLADNPACFQAFKQGFTDDHIQFVATTTLAGLKKIKEVDKDGSLDQRVTTIFIDSSSDEQNTAILYESISREAKDLPIKIEEVITKTLSLCNESYLPHMGRPAKVKKIFRAAIEHVKQRFSPHYISPELDATRQKYQILLQKSLLQFKKESKDFKQMEILRQELERLEKERNQQVQQVQLISQSIQNQSAFKQRHFALTHQLANANSVELTEELKNSYLIYYFYGIDAFKNVIKSRVKEIRDKIDIQLNGKLIEKVFHEKKLVEEKTS